MGVNVQNIISLDVPGADLIVRSLFRPTNEFRVFWLALNNEEKQAYIMRSTDEVNAFIEHMPYCSCSLSRIAETLKKAIVYNALGIMNKDLLAVADKQAQVLNSLGAISNMRITQASARVIASQDGTEAATNKQASILSSNTAYALLKPFFSGFRAIRVII